MVLKLQKTAIAESPNLSLNFDSAERFSEFRVEIWCRSIEPNSELFEKPVKSIDSPELMEPILPPAQFNVWDFSARRFLCRSIKMGVMAGFGCL